MIEVKDIKLNNKEVVRILDEYKDFIVAKRDAGLLSKDLKLMFPNAVPEDWLSDEYMHSIMNKGAKHNGYPDALKGYEGTSTARGPDMSDFVPDYREASSKLNRDLQSAISCKNAALNAVYPPGGFISWHNNANAAGYNIIITWSETGEGWFDYWDIEKEERVRIPDVPGWQAKMTYFGPYEDPDKLCYHAAGTDCLRITVAYVFAEADSLWEMVIEDLEDPVI